MEEPIPLTVTLLREIRDEIRSTNVRLDSTNERLDATNERLERLETRQVASEVRLATELVAVVGAVRELRDTLVADRELRNDVADHERRIRALERRRSSAP